jgi:thiol-disulfide isomerase/thioredoxin
MPQYGLFAVKYHYLKNIGTAMISKTKSLSGTLLLAALVFSSAVQAGPFKDLNGNSMGLENYTGKGKWTIVMFWASDCHVCNDEVQQYSNFHDRHQQKDAMVLGITLDGDAKKQDAMDFISRNSVTFPSLIGEAIDVTSLYSELTGRPWIGTPTFLVFDPKGELSAQQVGAVPAEIIENYISQQNTAAATAANVNH